MNPRRSFALRFALAAALATPGCMSNQSGDLAATRFGDLSHSLGPRSTLQGGGWSCPAGPVPGQPSLVRRRPYLQQATDVSVQVTWTAEAQLTEARLAVTSLDGAPVLVAAAVRDEWARPEGGAVQWQAPLTGLEPDSIYCYELLEGGTSVHRGGFRTAPSAGTGAPVRFVAIGDSGTGGADQRAVRDQLTTVSPDFMIHLGDIAYETGTLQQFERHFFDVYAELLKYVAVFPASGNHEYETSDAAPFREVFALPENGGPAGVERWYSYDWGDVHFVVLDTERVGAVQAQWLNADLAANRRPWTVVYLHRPPFSSGEHGSSRDVQKYFVPLFVKHHVPLVLAGHDHHYERSKPIDGVTYVVSGGGGRGTRQTGHASFTAFSEAVCHLLYVTIAGDELTLHAIDGVGQEFDSLLIRR
jgi:3',5'-cyclic AMP phosphodiesterase CpdA